MQHLLMNNGIHFSTYPVSSVEDIRSVCDVQLTGEVGCTKTQVWTAILATCSCTLPSLLELQKALEQNIRYSIPNIAGGVSTV